MMPFSVRVHPAPFSPTPNRHAGIKLKMKGGGPGASQLWQKLLAILDLVGEHEKAPVPKATPGIFFGFLIKKRRRSSGLVESFWNLWNLSAENLP